MNFGMVNTQPRTVLMNFSNDRGELTLYKYTETNTFEIKYWNNDFEMFMPYGLLSEALDKYGTLSELLSNNEE